MDKASWNGAVNLINKLRPVGIIITALLGALLALYALGPANYTIEGLTFSVSSLPARVGSTAIDLSPFGSVSASTHSSPLAVKIKLVYIGTGADTPLTEETVASIQGWNNIYEGLISMVKPFVTRQMIVIFFGAFFSVLIIWRSRFRTAFLSGLACMGLMALLLFSTAKTYDVQAFREPVYCGVIALAPQLIPEPGEFMDRLEELQADTRKVVGNMSLLMSSSNGLSILSKPIEDGALKKVLLISDMHSSPLGVEFAHEIASAFKVDLVLDAGDLTDLGTSMEAEYAAKLSSIKIPYVFCPGNHDTPEIIDFVSKLENGVVLDGKVINPAGITILGSPDPMASSWEVELKDSQAWELLMQEQADKLVKTAAAEEMKPDIVVVHNPQAAQKLTDDFSLIVYGHTHQQSIIINNGNILLNPGTSGAAGIRGLYAEQAVPYSAMVLYLTDEGLPAAVDTIKYEPFSDRFYIERKLLHSEFRKQPVVINEDSLAEDYVIEIPAPDEETL
ncbi:putative integral membrane protein [hydrocarbon metagenome]|uniref:Putative integral membrane protein n=1 Tax=hydrocarbon metagenome TaxID=938273 RepID=A0A0W8E4H2_9ZZZZ